MKRFYAVLILLAALCGSTVSIATPVQNCPFTAAQLAKPIKDIHFYLVYGYYHC
jgi:hypothetical protein